MLDFQQKRKVRAFMYHKLTLGVLLIAVLIVVHSTWVVYQKKRTSEEMVAVSSRHVEDLKQRSGELTSRIDRLGTVPGVEEEIRAKFSVAKDKENVVLVVLDSNTNATTTDTSGGFWQRLREFFGWK